MDNTSSLIFYIVSFAVSALCFHIGQKRKMRTATIVGLLIPTLVGGFRYLVGVDYVSYMSKLQVAEGMDLATFSNTFGGVEPALWAFGHFLPWQVFFAATSFLTTFFFYLGFKNFGSKHIGLCMFLMLLIIFPQAMGGIRQGVAMAICFYAFSFIPKRNLRVFIITVLCASLFHYSSLVMLCMYPLYYFVVLKSTSESSFIKRLFMIVFSTIAVIGIGFQIMQFIPFLSKYAMYTTTEFSDRYGEYTNTHNILPEMLAVGLMFVFYRHLIKKKPIGQLSFMSVNIMLIVTCLGFFIPLASRLADYYMAFFLLMLPGVIDIFSDRLGKRVVVGVVIMYALLFFIGGIYLNGSGGIFPYRFIFLQ